MRSLGLLPADRSAQIRIGQIKGKSLAPIIIRRVLVSRFNRADAFRNKVVPPMMVESAGEFVTVLETGEQLAAAITSKPAGAQDLPTLSFGTSNPVSITDASAVTVTLTITTTAPTNAALEHSARPGVRWHTGGMTPAFGLIFGIGICIPVRGCTRRRRLVPLFFVLILASGLFSCGGGGGNSGNSNPGTTPGAYVVTVTGTSDSITATSTITLSVQ